MSVQTAFLFHCIHSKDMIYHKGIYYGGTRCILSLFIVGHFSLGLFIKIIPPFYVWIYEFQNDKFKVHSLENELMEWFPTLYIKGSLFQLHMSCGSLSCGIVMSLALNYFYSPSIHPYPSWAIATHCCPVASCRTVTNSVHLSRSMGSLCIVAQLCFYRSSPSGLGLSPLFPSGIHLMAVLAVLLGSLQSTWAVFFLYSGCH